MGAADPFMAIVRRQRVINMLKAQMQLAAKYGCLVAYSKKDPEAMGADWDDPTKFAPPDLGCTIRRDQ